MVRTTLRRVVDAAMVDVCRGRSPEIGDEPGVEGELLRAVRFHRVAPLAHVALRDVRPDLAEPLRSDRDRALEHHLRASSSLAHISRALVDLSWAAFKGPVLSETLHPVPGLRAYRDLDLLVAPDALRESCSRLVDAGWQVLASTRDLLNGEVTGEIELARPGGVVIDLHWSLVLSQTLRRRFCVPSAELLARSVPITIGGVEARTFDAADTLVHLCHHAAFSGAVRLVHLLDVDQAARRTFDWDQVVRRARDWGAGAQVGVVLGRAHRILGTPLPPQIHRALGLSRAFDRLAATVDRLRPAPALRQEPSLPRLLARAARPSASRTVGTAVRNAALGLRNRMGPAPIDRPWLPASRDEVDSYLTAVESAARVALL